MADTTRRAARRATEPALEVRQLRVFVALVDHGSVTAAAHALGLAQSTVSESLSGLERVLGTSVTARRRGGPDLLLTAAGRALLPHARGVLAAVEGAQVAVAGATTAAHAVVDIVANESVGTYVLPGVLAALRKRWPNARFAVSVAMCPGVRAGVETGAFDLGFLLEAHPIATANLSVAEPGMPDASASRSILGVATVVPEVPLVIFGVPSHPLAAPSVAGVRRGVRRDLLSAYPLFLSDAAGDFHRLVRDFFAADQMPGPHLEPAGSVEGVKRGVTADPHALGLLPVYAVAEDLRAGRIVPIDVRPPPPRMRLDALLSRSRLRHPAVTELLDGVRAAFTVRPSRERPVSGVAADVHGSVGPSNTDPASVHSMLGIDI